MMARLHGAPAYIVHMTCRESVEALVRAKLEGQRCYGETCPQYVLLDDSVFTRPNFEGAAYVMSPPIRPAHMGHHDALWRSLSNGLLDSVGTDHCPFTMEQKRMGKDNFTLIPNGAAGIEDRLQLLFTYGVEAGKFDLQRMLALGSTNPPASSGSIRGRAPSPWARTPISSSTTRAGAARAAPRPITRSATGASSRASR